MSDCEELVLVEGREGGGGGGGPPEEETDHCVSNSHTCTYKCGRPVQKSKSILLCASITWLCLKCHITELTLRVGLIQAS